MKSLSNFLSYLSQAKFTDKATLESLLAGLMLDPQSFYDDDEPTYVEDSALIAKQLTIKNEDKEPIHITTNFNDAELEEKSIAYHRVFGSIIADERWYRYFSTKSFIANFAAAEKNPNIIAHFIHVSSGGGEAWLLDKAFEAVQNAQKPVIAFGEKVVASAGYYLVAAADKIYSYTQNDTWGSIGTMLYFMDITPYWTKLGIKEYELYATKSDLKNKKFNDVLKDKPKQYIEEELNPLQEQFETAVRSTRKIIAKLPDDDPVVRGETFATPKALENGLVDEMAEIDVAIQDAYNRGLEWQKKQKAHTNAISYL